MVQGVRLATLILMTTVPLSEAGTYVGVAVFPPVIEPVPLTIVQEILVGSLLTKVADKGLLMFSQKNPSFVKVIVACFEILIFKVLTIGIAQGKIGFTVNVK